MPFLNFESRHFSIADEAAIDNALQEFKITVRDKIAVLTAEERQQYVSISESYKVHLNNIKEGDLYMKNAEIDLTGLTSECQSRNFLEIIIRQLLEIIKGLENARILHDAAITKRL